jgi:hypothetical protein
MAQHAGLVLSKPRMEEPKIGSGRAPLVHRIGDREVSEEEFYRALAEGARARIRKRQEDEARAAAELPRKLTAENKDLRDRVAHLERRLRIASAENRRLKDVLSEVAASVAQWRE